MALPKQEYKNIVCSRLEVGNGSCNANAWTVLAHGAFLCFGLESFNNQAGTSLGL